MRKLLSGFIQLAMGSCLVCMVSVTALAADLGEGQSKTWTSGTHKLNSHVINGFDPNTEIISGKIESVTSSGIYMDGVYFPLIGAEIIDDKMRPAELKDLYIGLQVKAVKKYGSVSKLLCFNMIRQSSAPAQAVPDDMLRQGQGAPGTGR